MENTTIGLSTMPKDWMGDLPKSLEANKALMRAMKPGVELNYLKLDTLYLEEKIKNRELEWLLTYYRGKAFEETKEERPNAMKNKKPSQYFEEFDEKLEKIYQVLIK